MTQRLQPFNGLSEKLKLNDSTTKNLTYEELSRPIKTIKCRHGIFDENHPCGECIKLRQGLSSNEESQEMTTLLQQIGIRERFAKCDLNNFDTSLCNEQGHVLDITKIYCEEEKFINNGINFILLGSTGTGKTHLITGIAKKLIMQSNYRIKLWRPHDLVQDKFLKRQPYQAYTNDVDLLMLDDLGARPLNELERAVINDILYERYDRKQATVITSNFSTDELRAFLGERSYSRLADEPNIIFTLCWENQRKKYTLV